MLLYVIAGVALLLAALLALISSAFGLHGTQLLVLRLVFVLLGLAVAALFAWLAMRKKKAATTEAGKQVDTSEVDTLLREADKRLAESPRAGVKRLRDLPLIYVLGETGSAKTTAVIKSGLEPELLAGEAYRERDVVPTSVANIWYSAQAAMVEMGAAVRSSPAVWTHLLSRTRASAVDAARRGAPFRAAVVCVSCEQFMGAQTTESMQAAAGKLNASLRELARQLGSNVPVYVLLTKLDRVPGFTEYVHTLSPDEGNALLGAAPNATGLPTEQAVAAVTASIDGLLFSLGTARLDLLAREADPQQLAPAYQFPRELRRFRSLLATYLVELNRSSHLSSNPDLRVFCFTGVRAITIQQVAAAPQAAVLPKAHSVDDATGVFRVPVQSASPLQQVPSVYGEKVAQWTFLPRFFSEVVLRDEAALANTHRTGNGRMLQRVVYGAVAAVLLIYLCLLTTSYFANAALQSRVSKAAAALANMPSTTSVSLAQLQALDQLREGLVQLEGYRADGAPILYRWGLYRGNTLLLPTRTLYLQHFRQLLLTRTQQEIAGGLTTLPATPAVNASYNDTYAALRAYLITTSNPDKSTAEFLAPVLLAHLQRTGVAVSPQESALAQRQFEYYASILPTGNPYSIAPDGQAVTHARTYLSAFGGFERIYETILTAAAKASPSVDFPAQFPDSVGVVSEPHIVPAAFTRPGYTFVQEATAHPERYFSGEAWVLGQQAPQSLDTAALKSQLAARYTSDYLAQWTAFLKDAAVERYTDLPNAGKKLAVLSKNNSPLLALLYTVSHNTAVQTPDIATAFQAPQSVVAPGNADQYIGPANKAYVDALLALSAAVNQVAAAPPDPAAVAPVNTAAAAANLAAQQLAQAFHIDNRAHLDAVTLALLQQPITETIAVIRGAGPAQAAAGARGFCSAYNSLMGKAPFNPKATTQAAPGDLATLFQPGTGALWQLYNSNLKALLTQQGSDYVPAANAPMQVTPGFLKFFNRMAQLSQQLFPNSAKDAQLTFTLRSLPSAGVQSSAFKVDNQTLLNTDSSKQFLWDSKSASQATLTANTLPLSVAGPWAVFQLIGKAHIQKVPTGYDLNFPLELANTPVRAPDGTPVVVRYQLSGPGADVLVPGALSAYRCTSDVAK